MSYAEQTYEAKSGPPTVSTTLDRIEKAAAVLNESIDLLFKRLEMVTRSMPGVLPDPFVEVVPSAAPSMLVERLLSTERRLNTLARKVQEQTDALDVP